MVLPKSFPFSLPNTFTPEPKGNVCGFFKGLLGGSSIFCNFAIEIPCSGNPPDGNPPDGNPPDGNPPDGNPPDGNPPDGNPRGGNPPENNNNNNNNNNRW